VGEKEDKNEKKYIRAELGKVGVHREGFVEKGVNRRLDRVVKYLG